MADAPTPGKLLGKRVRAVRSRKDWSQQRLADEMELLGVPMDRSAVAKVETGARGVSIDEVFAFALALGVSPTALLVPRAQEQVSIAPRVERDAFGVAQWIRGIFPVYENSEPIEVAVRSFFDEVSDVEERAFREFPALRTLRGLASVAVAIAGVAEDTAGLERLRGMLEGIRDDAAAEIRRVNRRIKGGN